MPNLPTPTYTAVLCLSNKECTLLKGTPVLLKEGMYVRSLQGEHLGAIMAHSPQLHTITPKTKCVVCNNVDSEISDKELRSLIVCANFTLNFFRDSGAALIEHAFLIRHQKTHKVQRRYTIPGPWRYYDNRFKLDPKTEPKMFQIIFESCFTAFKKEEGLRVTLDRFNSAIAKQEAHDKVIDLAICLESLFPFSTEIAFRFALYNAIISTDDVTRRRSVFKLLRDLYKARSAIVHGSEVPEDKPTEEEFHRLNNVARSSILYKVEYLNQHGEGWRAHLDDLAMGLERQ